MKPRVAWALALLMLLLLWPLTLRFSRPRQMVRPTGMAQSSWTALINASRRAGIQDVDRRVTQTIGDHEDSRGTHRADGVLNGEPYCAAIDLHVDNLSKVRIRDWLRHLGESGFAAFYREPPLFGEHIHAVYAGLPMKPVLKRQVRSYLEGKNGLRVPRPLPPSYRPTSVAMGRVAKLMGTSKPLGR